MSRFKRNVPQINSTSSADIAFILLLFFLLTGSLDSKTGIYRHLSPKTSELISKKKRDVEKRNYLAFSIDSNNALLLNDESVTLPEIREVVKTFLSNPDDLDILPEKEMKEVEGVGMVSVTSKAVIELFVSRQADYQTYISVLNELNGVYYELRNELSHEKFNITFNDLKEEQQKAIREAYPMRIVEKELPGKEEANE
jgi:biopolymer transport protein ExbD